MSVGNIYRERCIATGSTNPRNDVYQTRNDMRGKSSRTDCEFYCRSEAVMRLRNDEKKRRPRHSGRGDKWSGNDRSSGVLGGGAP